MIKAYLGLGSNIGDTKMYLDKAVAMLNCNADIEVTEVSSYYETEPVGYTDQDWFLNIVAEVETTLGPYELLKTCNEIEAKLKRERLIRWGPRTIDIDILLYEGFESDDPVLTVPHPRMTERAFVMLPLMELNNELAIGNTSIKDIVKNLENQEIRKL